MKNTVKKGAGNSQLLKSVPNLRTLAPTYDVLLDYLVGAGLPVDLSNLQAAGCNVIGTPYAKETMLPDSLDQALFGSLSADRTPAQAMEKLRQLVVAAQNIGDAKARLITGSYTGDGNDTKTLGFGNFSPKIVINSGGPGDYYNGFYNEDYIMIAIRPQSAVSLGYGFIGARVSTGSVSWDSYSITISAQYPTFFNVTGRLYYYAAIC